MRNYGRSVTNLRSYHCDFTIVTIWLLLNKDASWKKQSVIIGRLFGADNRPKHYRCTSSFNLCCTYCETCTTKTTTHQSMWSLHLTKHCIIAPSSLAHRINIRTFACIPNVIQSTNAGLNKTIITTNIWWIYSKNLSKLLFRITQYIE